ncbi:hypothetical protein E4U52_006527 [Claviceps spartinae]|nr:hypothetical protein E4U52_006527 [Claviceps spartinae]
MPTKKRQLTSDNQDCNPTKHSGEPFSYKLKLLSLCFSHSTEQNLPLYFSSVRGPLIQSLTIDEKIRFKFDTPRNRHIVGAPVGNDGDARHLCALGTRTAHLDIGTRDVEPTSPTNFQHLKRQRAVNTAPKRRHLTEEGAGTDTTAQAFLGKHLDDLDRDYMVRRRVISKLANTLDEFVSGFRGDDQRDHKMAARNLHTTNKTPQITVLRPIRSSRCLPKKAWAVMSDPAPFPVRSRRLGAVITALCRFKCWKFVGDVGSTSRVCRDAPSESRMRKDVAGVAIVASRCTDNVAIAWSVELGEPNFSVNC